MNTTTRSSRPQAHFDNIGSRASGGLGGRGVPLPPAVSGERREFDSIAGRLSYYVEAPAGASDARPLLLIHSVNAAASAYEVKPIYEHYARQRPVYALELPGFGFSARREIRYTPRLMTDAVHAMVAEIRRLHGAVPVDALALSLGSEFLARAAQESPSSFSSLALISPTGFDQRGSIAGPAGSTRGMPLLHGIFTVPLWSRRVFELLTSRRSIRFFLEKTWGSEEIDEGALEYSWLTTHQPGARFAPYDFVSGYLFSRDISRIYQALQMPVWMAHGVRGDFVDYRAAPNFARKPNWKVVTWPTGALPHFEMPGEFMRRYDVFLDTAAAAR